MLVNSHQDWVGVHNSKKWGDVLWSVEVKINYVGNNGKPFVRCKKITLYH